MSSEFVPFLKSSVKSVAIPQGRPASPLAAMTDSPAATAAFSALVPSKPVPGPSAVNAAASCANAPEKSKPVVTLKRNGDQVTHIHIQCGCGEVVELECAY